MTKHLFTYTTLLLGFLTFAQSSPIGVWKTIDDKTGKEKSYVRIYETKTGKLQGEVIKILTPGKEDAKCEKCDGDNKNKPIKGLTIVWGLEKTGDGWTGGHILDPNSGKKYKCSMKLEGNDKLNVRGFVGVSLIGRTQTWERVE